MSHIEHNHRSQGVICKMLALAIFLALAIILISYSSHRQMNDAFAQGERSGIIDPILVSAVPSESTLSSTSLRAPFIRRSDGEVGISIVDLDKAINGRLTEPVPISRFQWERPFLWELQSRLEFSGKSFATDISFFSNEDWKNVAIQNLVSGTAPTSDTTPEVFLGRYSALHLRGLGIKPEDIVGQTVNIVFAVPSDQAPSTKTPFPLKYVEVPAKVTGVALRDLDKADKHGRLKTAGESGADFDASWIREDIANYTWLSSAAAKFKVVPPESLIVYSIPFVFKDTPFANQKAFASLSRYEERKALLNEYRTTGTVPYAIENFVYPREFTISTDNMTKNDVTALLGVLDELGLNAQAIYPRNPMPVTSTSLEGDTTKH